MSVSASSSASASASAQASASQCVSESQSEIEREREKARARARERALGSVILLSWTRYWLMISWQGFVGERKGLIRRLPDVVVSNDCATHTKMSHAANDMTFFNGARDKCSFEGWHPVDRQCRCVA